MVRAFNECMLVAAVKMLIAISYWCMVLAVIGEKKD